MEGEGKLIVVLSKIDSMYYNLFIDNQVFILFLTLFFYYNIKHILKN